MLGCPRNRVNFNRTLNAKLVEILRAFAADHDCIFSYTEFTREPPLFEKLEEEIDDGE